MDPLKLQQEPCHDCLQSQHTNNHSVPSEDIPQGQFFLLLFCPFFVSLPVDDGALFCGLAIEGVELNSASEKGDRVVAKGLPTGLAIGLFLGLLRRLTRSVPGESFIRLMESFLCLPLMMIAKKIKGVRLVLSRMPLMSNRPCLKISRSRVVVWLRLCVKSRFIEILVDRWTAGPSVN